MKQIHRYEVPIDDQVHEFSLTGNILHVAQRSDHAVEFWAFDIEGNPVEEVRLQVFGTGMEIPVASVYRGTAFSPAGGFDPFPIPAGKYVWHLVQLLDEELYAQVTAVNDGDHGRFVLSTK